MSHATLLQELQDADYQDCCALLRCSSAHQDAFIRGVRWDGREWQGKEPDVGIMGAGWISFDGPKWAMDALAETDSATHDKLREWILEKLK